MSYPNITDWISAIAHTIACFSLLLIVWQVWVSQERARREKAVEILRDFDNARTKSLFRYFQLVGELCSNHSESVKKIYEAKSITIDKALAEKYWPELTINENSDKICLDANSVLEIRFTIVGLLNAIESIALAYKNGVADEIILHEAFYSFFIENNFLDQVEIIINNFGVQNWPTIQELKLLMLKRPRKRGLPTDTRFALFHR